MSGGFLDFLGLGRPDASLRTAVPGDAEALAALHAGAFRIGWDAAEFERLLANRLIRALVATEGEKLIGFILLSGVAPEIEILSVAVSKNRQGRGIGGRLIASAFGTLAAEGFTTVFLEVEEGNAAAIHLYARCGFTQIGRRTGYYRDPNGNPVAALVMRRDIA